MVIYVTQTRLHTTIEISRKQYVYPRHVSIFSALTNHRIKNVSAIYIADLRQLLLIRQLRAINNLFVNADVYHLGLLQPAHAIISMCDNSDNIIIANDFGTAGEVITYIEKNKIVYQIRGYEKSLGLLVGFASEYLNIDESKLLSTSFTHNIELIKNFNKRRITKDVLRISMLTIQLSIFKWFNDISKDEIINFVRNYIHFTVNNITKGKEVSKYGKIFDSRYTDTDIPRKMHICSNLLIKYQ